MPTIGPRELWRVRGEVNLARYCALDGATDDSAGWLAAIAATPAGGRLVVPSGTTIVDPVALGSAIAASITIEGHGLGSVIRVKANAGDYASLFGTASAVANVTFRNLRIDQNAANQDGDIQALAGKQQYAIDVDADNLVVEGCWFDCCGVNTVLTQAGAARLRIEGCDFVFSRGAGAATTPYYDNSAIYSRSTQAIIRGNRFRAAAVAGVFAFGAIEVHAADAVVAGNQTLNYATLCNWAPSEGAGDQAAVIADNVAVNCNKGIQLWLADASRGLLVANNVIQVRQTLWGLKNFGGILSGTGTAELSDFAIVGNVIDIEQELARAAIVDAIDGAAEQQYASAGIGLLIDGATYTDGLVQGNTVRNCPFAGYSFGGEAGTSVFNNVTVANNVSVNNGHNNLAASNSYRAHFRWRGLVNYCAQRHNTLRESHSPILSRYQTRADQGTFVGCEEEGNRYLHTAASPALAARAFGGGWQKHKAPVSATATYDPPNLAAGVTGAWQSVTVPGAALGDRVAASWSAQLPSDAAGGRVELQSEVSAADTCRYRFVNGTSSGQDIASGTATVTVW